MSVLISSIVTNINSQIGDSSTDRVSSAERYEAITEATAWLLEELGNEHMVNTYELSYLDTINYYNVTGAIPDVLTGADMRREVDNYYSFARKSPREMSEEIARKETEPSWAIERLDDDLFLVVNAPNTKTASYISHLTGLTDGGGTWTLDTTTSDALNLTVDSAETWSEPSALNFDIDVSQSGNNRATIYNNSISNLDLSTFEDKGSFILETYIPDATYITSVTLSWGTGTNLTPATKANYWTATATTDINGNAFRSGWNTVKVDWIAATKSGTPSSSNCSYHEITVNYSASQADDTDYRINTYRIASPEKLIFHYISWNVGQVSSADVTPITAFTADTNVPFFSGKYDQYKYAVAHKASSILFGNLRLRQEAIDYDSRANESLTRYRKNFESSKVREVKSWKVMGVNLRRRRIR